MTNRDVPNCLKIIWVISKSLFLPVCRQFLVFVVCHISFPLAAYSLISGGAHSFVSCKMMPCLIRSFFFFFLLHLLHVCLVGCILYCIWGISPRRVLKLKRGNTFFSFLSLPILLHPDEMTIVSRLAQTRSMLQDT